MYFTILLLVILVLPIPIIMSEMKRGTGAYRAILSAIIGVAVASIIIFIMSEASGQSISALLSHNMDQAAGILAENQNLSSLFGMTELSVKERSEVFIAIYETTLNTLPGTILTWAAVIAYFEYMLMAGIINSSGNKVPRLPKLSQFSLPKTAVWGFIVIFVLSWLLSLTKILPDTMLMSNINTIFGFIISVQGLSIVFCFFQAKRWPKVVAIVMTFVFLSTAIGKTLLFLLGLLDFLFDLKGKISRRLHV